VVQHLRAPIAPNGSGCLCSDVSAMAALARCDVCASLLSHRGCMYHYLLTARNGMCTSVAAVCSGPRGICGSRCVGACAATDSTAFEPRWWTTTFSWEIEKQLRRETC
jgi:hypothetical protein